MRNLLIVATLILSFQASMFGQFGIKAGYHFNKAADWELIPSAGETTQPFIGDGSGLGIDYWFRLKNKRIEFLPEINFAYFNTFETSSPDILNQAVSFYFNTNIYFLDLANDCNCPTFSKQNDLVKKGLFVQLSPGFSTFFHQIKTEEVSASFNHSAFNIGGAIGLDIGISNLITISPIAGFRYFLPAKLNDFKDVQLQIINDFFLTKEESDLQQFFVALRFGVRLDKDKY